MGGLWVRDRGLAVVQVQGLGGTDGPFGGYCRPSVAMEFSFFLNTIPIQPHICIYIYVYKSIYLPIYIYAYI